MLPRRRDKDQTRAAGCSSRSSEAPARQRLRLPALRRLPHNDLADTRRPLSASEFTAFRRTAISRVNAVVVGDYRDLFVVIATSAATLIGLLFVAMSVAKGRVQTHSQVIREFRAAASLLAFTNAFTVALFGLVPGNNIGYPAGIVGVIGVLFTAAGVRTTLSLPSEEQHRRPQFALVVALLLVFGFQTFNGVQLIIDSHHRGSLATIGDVLIASLLIGIGRAWELVGDWDTGIVASIGRLVGHQPQVQGTSDHERTEGSETGQVATSPKDRGSSQAT